MLFKEKLNIPYIIILLILTNCFNVHVKQNKISSAEITINLLYENQHIYV